MSFKDTALIHKGSTSSVAEFRLHTGALNWRRTGHREDRKWLHIIEEMFIIVHIFTYRCGLCRRKAEAGSTRGQGTKRGHRSSANKQRWPWGWEWWITHQPAGYRDKKEKKCKSKKSGGAAAPDQYMRLYRSCCMTGRGTWTEVESMKK